MTDDLAFTLTVEMLSDWQIGTGTGRHGSIDQLTEREDGLPFIPASTLRGMWRDSMETLAHGLDDGASQGRWQTLVEWLMGNQPALADGRAAAVGNAPIRSRVNLDHLRFPEELRAALRPKETEATALSRVPDPDVQLLRDALTFVKAGVAIDVQSGRAKDHFLRFDEVARGGAILIGSGQARDVPQDEAERQTVAAFLLASATMIERIGSDRRRGLGRCSVTVAFEDKSLPSTCLAAAKVLETAGHGPALKSAPASNTVVFRQYRADVGWIRIALTLHLEASTLIADEVLGNVTTSLDVIPGAYLLPHVTRALGAAGITTPEASIAAAEIRVLPATPDVAGERGFPALLCWEEPKIKDEDTTILPGRNQLTTTAVGGGQHKPLRGGYFSEKGGRIMLVRRVRKQTRTHNTIRDDVQRPTEDIGGVYTYELIDAGQTFHSELWIRPSLIEDKINPLIEALSGSVRLGRARQAGNGKATCVATLLDAPLPAAGGDGMCLTVRLASDMILRDEALSGAASLLDLADAIAVVARRNAGDLFKLGEARGALRTRRIESWQTHWGLPRPSLVGLRAGSVAIFPYATGQSIARERLEQLAQEGLGERRAEGYGQILVNDPLTRKPAVTLHTIEPGRRSSRADTHLGSGHRQKFETFCDRLEEMAWRQAVEIRAEYASAARDRRTSSLRWTNTAPNMSQIGALLSVMGRLETDDDCEAVRHWITRVQGNESRNRKWPEGALARLRDLISDADSIWRTLHFGAPDDPSSRGSSIWGGAAIPALTRRAGGRERVIRERLRLFAVRSLLLSAMRNHKRDLEKSS